MKKTLFLIFVIGFLSSCNNTDESSNTITNELNGEWNLVAVSCFCEPIHLEAGDHIWTFNLSANMLNILNNVTEDLHTIPDTGVYEISFSENTVTLLDVEYDYYFENDRLYLANQPEADGPLIEFIRE
ncbi:hypothetical protein [Psychroserpens algicola]|uniref:hypothetical protein n=1 Tax=Psychroserpens algicola TaxID=1719034 RepID=UPI0019540556|nr:hypothetical protein [Psychroserpens algicola]